MPICRNDVVTSAGESLPKRAEELIPHSGPMCVIDDLTAVGERTAEAVVTVREDSPFLRRDGTMEESVFVEMIAQTIAAGSGFEVSAGDRESQSGYLLGIREMKIMGCARAGDTLKIQAFKYAEYGAFGVIQGSVLRGDEVLARGEIKVIQIFDNKSAAEMLPNPSVPGL